jgi:Family of unknown function (DUF6221)
VADDLVTFLRARLDEDEARSAAAAGSGTAEWRRALHPDTDTCAVEDATSVAVVYNEGSPSDAEADHIAANDPARVLRQVKAGRAILNLHRQLNESVWCATCDPGGENGDGAAWYPCLTLRLMATAYSNHPDYRPEWAPA